jgi:protein TonB
MSKIDLASAEWRDLVFVGKNHAYGAYKMRADSPRRHNLALLLVIIIAAIGFSIPALMRLATPKGATEKMTEVTTLSQLEEPEVKQQEMKKVEPLAPPPPALKSSIKFTAPVIKKDEEVKDEDEIKTQDELKSAKAEISLADVKGNDEENGKDIAELKQVVTQAKEPEKVFDMVEQMPTYPGGVPAMYKWISEHMHYPVIAEENGTQGRVIVQFVVNKDGSIVDAKVVRSVDPYLDKEALRVINAMPKWKPGMQRGKPVRVKYTVPVMFRLQ